MRLFRSRVSTDPMDYTISRAVTEGVLDGGDRFSESRDGEVDSIVVYVNRVDVEAADVATQVMGEPSRSVAHAAVGSEGTLDLLPDEYAVNRSRETAQTSLVLEISWGMPESDRDETLREAAAWAARRVDRHEITVQLIDRDQWRDHRTGFIDGEDWTGSGDGDFPWERFLDMVDDERKRRRFLIPFIRPSRSSTARTSVRAAAAAGAAGVAVVAAVGLVQLQSDDPTETSTSTDSTVTVPPSTPTTSIVAASASPTTTVPGGTGVVDGVAGEWMLTVDVTQASGACAGEAETEPYVRTVSISFVEDRIEVVGLGDGDEPWIGLFEDGVLTFEGDRSEGGGVTTARFELVEDEQGGGLIGSEIWSWTDGTLVCEGGVSEVRADDADNDGLTAAVDQANVSVAEVLVPGDWSAHGIASGVATASSDGIDITWEGWIPALFEFTVVGDSDVASAVGEWRHWGGALMRLGGAQLAADAFGNVTFSGTGSVGGFADELELDGVSNTTGSVTIEANGVNLSIPVATTSTISGLAVTVEIVRCNEAYGDWVYTVEQEFQDAGFETSFDGFWFAIRDPGLADRQTRSLLSGIDATSDIAVASDSSSIIRRLNALMLSELDAVAVAVADDRTDSVIGSMGRYETLVNRWRNASPCAGSVTGQTSEPTYESAATASTLAMVELARPGSTDSASFVNLAHIATRSGAVGFGAADEVAAATAERALIAIANAVLDEADLAGSQSTEADRQRIEWVVEALNLDVAAPRRSVLDGLPRVDVVGSGRSGSMRPVLEWERVGAADHYAVYVFGPDGSIYWTWRGTETSVPVGGWPQLAADAEGPSTSHSMSWMVVAVDDDLLPVAVSDRAPTGT